MLDDFFGDPDPSSGRWHKLTCGGNHHASIVEPLRLRIDILRPVGKNFIFQERTLLSRKELYFPPTISLCTMTTY
jgi:hypothetical protein